MADLENTVREAQANAQKLGRAEVALKVMDWATRNFEKIGAQEFKDLMKILGDAA